MFHWLYKFYILLDRILTSTYIWFDLPLPMQPVRITT